ncbi:hypothetical protein LCGC14_2586460, partial [marine sediment metagenome]
MGYPTTDAVKATTDEVHNDILSGLVS